MKPESTTGLDSNSTTQNTHTTIKDEDVVEIQLSEDAVPASKMLSEIYRNPGSVDVLPER